jgi:hypothetical protein
MFITLVAVVCHSLAGSPACVEEVVADSDTNKNLTLISCALSAQAVLAQWKAADLTYRGDDYWINRYKCVPGHPEGHRARA